MPFTYKPLWKLLIDKNLKREQLKQALGLSPATMAKMSKNEFVSMGVLHRICQHLNCQPGDLIEYVKEEGNN